MQLMKDRVGFSLWFQGTRVHDGHNSTVARGRHGDRNKKQRNWTASVMRFLISKSTLRRGHTSEPHQITSPKGDQIFKCPS